MMQGNQDEEKKKLEDVQALVKNGNDFYESGEYDKAIVYYMNILSLYPDTRGVLDQIGSYFDKQGKFEDAIYIYNEIISLNPKYVYAYVNRGISYENLRNYLAGTADYNKALQIDPRCAYAYYKRAGCFRKMNRFSRALRDYEEAKKFSTVQEDKEDCDRKIKKILSLGPVNTTTIVLRQAELSPIMPEHPLELPLNKVICDFETEIRNSDGLISSGQICEYFKKYDQAIVYYTEVLKVAPNAEYIINRRGICYYKIGNFKAAIADFSNAIELASSCANLYFNRGICNKAEGNFKAAIEDFNQAVYFSHNCVCVDGLLNIASCEVKKYCDEQIEIIKSQCIVQDATMVISQMPVAPGRPEEPLGATSIFSPSHRIAILQQAEEQAKQEEKDIQGLQINR